MQLPERLVWLEMRSWLLLARVIASTIFHKKIDVSQSSICVMLLIF